MNKNLESLVNTYMPSKKGWWVGRATSAIAISIRSISMLTEARKIIVPSTGCAALVQIVLYEGFKPVYVDLDFKNMSFDKKSILEAIDEDVAAILVVHQLGMPSNINQIKNLIRKKTTKHIYIIEDVCQALGGSYNGEKLGSQGDYSVYSFSGDKIISIGKGGYLGCNNSEIVDITESLIPSLPPMPDIKKMNLLALSHRNLYHSFVDLQRTNKSISLDFSKYINYYKDLYYFKSNFTDHDLERLEDEFENLEKNNNRRIEMSEIFYEGFKTISNVKIPEYWKKSGCLWRFSIYLPKDLQIETTNKLRLLGYDVSNHYWSLPRLFGDSKKFKNTDLFINSVINFWVDKNMNPEKARDIINSTVELIT